MTGSSGSVCHEGEKKHKPALRDEHTCMFTQNIRNRDSEDRTTSVLMIHHQYDPNELSLTQLLRTIAHLTRVQTAHPHVLRKTRSQEIGKAGADVLRRGRVQYDD